jgi:hypothetical protein
VMVPRICPWFIDWAKTTEERQPIPIINPKRMANRPAALIAIPLQKEQKTKLVVPYVPLCLVLGYTNCQA